MTASESIAIGFIVFVITFAIFFAVFVTRKSK